MINHAKFERVFNVVAGSALTVAGLGAAAMSVKYGVETAAIQPQMEMFASLREAERNIALATGGAGVILAGAGVSLIQSAVVRSTPQ